MPDLTAVGGVVAAVGGLTGVLGIVFSRNKTRAEADSVVVASSEKLTTMWESMSSRLEARVQQLEQELRRQKADCTEELRAERNRTRKVEIRCFRLERALRAAGINLPEDG